MLVTLDEAKTYLGVTDSGEDGTITDLAEAATEAMEQAAGRRLESANVIEYLNGTGRRLLWLCEPPDGGKDGITSIHVDSDRSWGDANLVGADEYYVDDCTVEYLDRVWPWGQRNVRVVYAAGYGTVPHDLEHACLVQVAKLYAEWRAAEQGLNNLQSHGVQGWSQRFLAHHGLDPEVAEVVARYKPARL